MSLIRKHQFFVFIFNHIYHATFRVILMGNGVIQGLTQSEHIISFHILREKAPFYRIYVLSVGNFITQSLHRKYHGDSKDLKVYIFSTYNLFPSIAYLTNRWRQIVFRLLSTQKDNCCSRNLSLNGKTCFVQKLCIVPRCNLSFPFGIQFYKFLTGFTYCCRVQVIYRCLRNNTC